MRLSSLLAIVIVSGIFSLSLSSQTEVSAADNAVERELTTRQIPVDFVRDVQPLLKQHCFKCHSGDKREGGFRLDFRTEAIAGGDAGVAILKGDSAKSPLITRVSGEEPDLVMPPEGDRLTATEIATIRAWITEDVVGVDSGVGAEVLPVKDVAAGTTDAAKAEADREAVAIAGAVDALRGRGVLVMRIAQDSEEWEINGSLVSPKFTDEDLSLMNGLQRVLVWANFTRTDLTDAGLVGLDGYDRLRSLRLSQTSIGDGGVDALLKLEGLEVLNLYASSITDAGILRLAELPNLRRLYCADSAVTPEGVVAAMAVRDGLEIIGSATPPVSKEPDASPSEGDE